MREPHLMVPANLRLKATRTPSQSQPRPTKPDAWWGIAMTKVLVEGFGWVYVVLVRDWYTTQIGGHYAGLPCTAWHWLAALDMVVNRQFPGGVREQGLSRMCDHGCQPTAVAFMEACSTLGLRQALTSDNHPTGNADTARVMRTPTEECCWRQEWTSPFALIHALERWIVDDNEPDLHSALGYKAPSPFERAYHTSHSPPFVAA